MTLDPANPLKSLKRMARETGLEPATSGVTGRRSNQLSYSRSGKLNSSAQRVVDVSGTPT